MQRWEVDDAVRQLNDASSALSRLREEALASGRGDIARSFDSALCDAQRALTKMSRAYDKLTKTPTMEA